MGSVLSHFKIRIKPMDITKIDMNAPAFSPLEVEKAEEPSKDKNEEAPASDSQPEKEKVEEPVKEPAESVEEAEDEQRVPYSRFKKFHDEARQARQEAEYWRQQAQSKPEPKNETKENSDAPAWWIKLYGDSPQTREGWQIYAEEQNKFATQVKEEARREIELQRIEETRKVEENVSTIDNNLETLSSFLGRELTEKEQSSVLDIVDEYTPKDDDGNYLGGLLPFDKAWEIYELKQKSQKSASKESRDKVAQLTGSPSQKEASGDSDKNFNPSWNALDDAIKRRL